MPKFTVCVAFYDADTRATVEVEADDYAGACREAVRMVDDGEASTSVATFEPSPTFVYGVVRDDGDPFDGAANVPPDLAEGHWYAAPPALRSAPAPFSTVRRPMDAEFSLYLTIDDAEALAKAAATRAVSDGVFDSEEEYLAEHDANDGTTHLRMLLDPGTLKGCSIIDSSARTN